MRASRATLGISTCVALAVAGCGPLTKCDPRVPDVCAGIGGCAGSRVCLDDGSGFGACECPVAMDAGRRSDAATRADARSMGVDAGVSGCGPCSAAEQCCGSTCVARSGVPPGTDGRDDPSFVSCSLCGLACHRERSSACSVLGGGRAQCACGFEQPCRSGECLRDSSGFRCFDLSSDRSNCGGVGIACEAGEECTMRRCVCGGGPPCPAPLACCGAGCIDTTTDRGNCGACGHVCAPSEVCSAGTCRCGASSCRRALGADLGQLCCGDACVEQGPARCGSCTRACNSAVGEECRIGPDPGGTLRVCCAVPSGGEFPVRCPSP